MTTEEAFVDIETTGLGSNCDVWEIAVIIGEDEYCWQQVIRQTATVDPWVREHGLLDRYDKWTALSREASATRIAELLDGKHLVGMNPRFDANFLQKLLSEHHVDYYGTNREPWHYHLLDCEALMIGYLAAMAIPVGIPWKSDDLSRAVGIEPPKNRHSALEDARWAKEIYEKVML